MLKKIIFLIYFYVKIILKNNHYYTLKHPKTLALLYLNQVK